MRSYRSPLERFSEKYELDQESGCWLWTACLYTTGYGKFFFGPGSNGPDRAHRWSYIHFIGPIPEGMQVDHSCLVRRCVNPEHLRLVTNKQNQENLLSARLGRMIPRGVTRLSDTRWMARVKHEQRGIYLGIYPTMAEAAEVARLKRLELFTHNDGDR